MRRRGFIVFSIFFVISFTSYAFADTPMPSPQPINSGPLPQGQPGQTNQPGPISAPVACAWGSSPGSSINLKTYSEPYANASDWGLANPPNGNCNVGIEYMTGNRGIGTTSLIAYANPDYHPNGPDAHVDCSSGGDSACSPTKWKLMWSQNTFYRCGSDTDLNCVQNFQVLDENGNALPVTFEKGFPDNAVRAGFTSPNVTYPPGGNPSIWKIQTPKGPVKVLINGWKDIAWDSDGSQWRPRPGKSFQLFIIPIEEQPLQSDRSKQTCFGMNANTCLVQDASLPTNYRFNVSLNLTDDATMFLNGRIDAPVAYTEPIQGGHRFTIQAGASPALSVAQWLPKSAIPLKVMNDVASQSISGNYWLNDNMNQNNSEFRVSGGEDLGVQLLNAMLPYLGDKVSFTQYVWSVVNNPTSDRYVQNCQSQASGQFLGIVSTNATAYRGDPPNYNKATQSLDYEISAPHYMPDGVTNSVGRYSINMNSKFLTCILGVSKVPTSATVGLTYGNGESSVSTLNVMQDKDWLRLNLNNFHFSSPKISIKFNQLQSEVTPTPAPTPTPSAKLAPPQSAPVKKVASSTSITCVKGRTIKKITAIKPVCPTGYKLQK